MGEGSKWVKVGCMKERKGGDKGKGKGGRVIKVDYVVKMYLILRSERAA